MGIGYAILATIPSKETQPRWAPIEKFNKKCKNESNDLDALIEYKQELSTRYSHYKDRNDFVIQKT